jgi:hypothetical protein
MQITKETFNDLAKLNYNNPQCESIEEFQNDLQRFCYVERLFNKYKNKGILKDKLLFNHIIILSNLFGIPVATEFLLFKIRSEYHSLLLTFLYFLNYIEKPSDDMFDLKLFNRLSKI